VCSALNLDAAGGKSDWGTKKMIANKQTKDADPCPRCL
jgi:hypothetical protein